jgi:hypothetical protein
MNNRTLRSSLLEQALGALGLLLIGLVVWACEQRTDVRTVPGRSRRALAWLVIQSVTAVGWAIDRLFPPARPVQTRPTSRESCLN